MKKLTLTLLTLLILLLPTLAYSRDPGPGDTWKGINGTVSGRPRTIVVSDDAISFVGNVMSLDVANTTWTGTTYVPYAGAVSDVNLGNHNITTTGTVLIDHDTSGTVTESLITSTGELASTTENTTMNFFFADMYNGTSYPSAGTQVKRGYLVDNVLRGNQTGGDYTHIGLEANMGTLAELPSSDYAVNHNVYGAYLWRSSLCVGDANGGSWDDVTAYGIYLKGWGGGMDDDSGLDNLYKYAIYSDGGNVELADGNITTTGTLGAGATTLTGALAMGANTITTTGTLSAGAITGTSITDGTATLDDGALSGITTIGMNNQLTNTLAGGTKPFVITSTTMCDNLNADLWDGYQFADYLDQAVKQASSPTFVGLTLSGAIATPTTITASGTITGGSLTGSDLTSGRITYASTAGLLADSGALTWNGSEIVTSGIRTLSDELLSDSGFDDSGKWDDDDLYDQWTITGSAAVHVDQPSNLFNKVAEQYEYTIGAEYVMTAVVTVNAGGGGTISAGGVNVITLPAIGGAATYTETFTASATTPLNIYCVGGDLTLTSVSVKQLGTAEFGGASFSDAVTFGSTVSMDTLDLNALTVSGVEGTVSETYLLTVTGGYANVGIDGDDINIQGSRGGDYFGGSGATGDAGDIIRSTQRGGDGGYSISGSFTDTIANAGTMAATGNASKAGTFTWTGGDGADAYGFGEGGTGTSFIFVAGDSGNSYSGPSNYDGVKGGGFSFTTGAKGAAGSSGVASTDGDFAVNVNDGKFDLTGKAEISSTLFVKDKIYFTQTDGNEYIDSLNDGYMDYRATTGHRFNNTIDITTTTDPQLRLTHTDGADETDFYTNSDGELEIMPTARTIYLGDGTAGDATLGFYGNTSVYTFIHDDSEGELRLSANDTTNYAQFADDGELTLAGTAKYKRYHHFEFNYATVRANGKPTQVTRGMFSGFSLPVYNNDNEELFSCACTPHDWDGTTDPIVYLSGWLTGNEDVDDDFNLQVSVETYDPASHDNIPTTSNDYPVETNITNGNNAQYDSYGVSFTLDASTIGMTAGQPLGIRIRRIAAAGTEIDNEFAIQGAVLMWTCDKLGEAT